MAVGDGRMPSCCHSRPCWDRLASRSFTPRGGAYERHSDPEQHQVGKENTQTIESHHLKLRTRSKWLVRRTICFAKTTTMHDRAIGLFINRYELGGAL
jgi:insertion element IS1 protein InsB